MKPWQRIEPTTVHKVGYRTIISKTFKMPDGSTQTWDIKDTEGSRAAAVIALTPDNQVVIARQYRPGQEAFLNELPGGEVDSGEDSEKAALRELGEETGYVPGAIEFLGKVYKDGYSNSTTHFYLATDCTLKKGLKAPGPHEYIEVRLVSIDDLIAAAKGAQMTDIEAVFLAYDKLMQLKEKNNVQ
ncbi:MAG TPA: NUDIX hydrolase [Patescibacteria group bacterium]|nr:NUDIX hydrolase [Patescibacteria group bacterium]